MLESLKELSDRATPGEAYAYMDHYHLIAHPAGSTYVGDQKLIALCACGDKAGANVHFLATLWTLYRRGELHDATALAEAKAEGRRQGLEEAAKNDHSKDFQLLMVRIIQRHRNGRDLTETLEGAADLLRRKGSLSPFRATAPAETQKPETGEPRPCKWCGGDGNSPTSEDGRCEDCGGTGFG